MICVTLCEHEIKYADYLGRWRQNDSEVHHRIDKYGAAGKNDLRLHMHKLGAAGEIAFCKGMNIYFAPDIWNSFGNDGDAAGDIQIRTRTREDFDLIIRRKDNPRHRYCLVIGNIPVIGDRCTFKIVGWNYGYRVMRDEFIRNFGGYGEAFFVPRSELIDPVELDIRGHVEESNMQEEAR